MSYLAPSTPFLQAGRIDQGSIRGESQRKSPRTVSIHILDDDSLLNMFYLYRPVIFDRDEVNTVLIGAGKAWELDRWWYKPAQVCQRWRNIILGSASYLGLCLFCTYGTPVANMLAHSPPLPLVIDYSIYWPISTKDRTGTSVALEKRNRIHRVRLRMPLPYLQKLITTMEGEYPVLEYLNLQLSLENTNLLFPETFQAPHLRHLLLEGFSLPMGSRLLTTAVGLVTFALISPHPSTYFQPSALLQWLSSLPQLENLLIRFSYPVPGSDVERQLMHTPIMTNVTLPNLCLFEFQGSSPYIEAVVHRITTPRLVKLCIHFLNQPPFSIPSLLQFMNQAENIRFDSARFQFSMCNQVYVAVYLREEAEVDALSITVDCREFDQQVSFLARIFSSCVQISSTVEHLTLELDESSEDHYEINRTEWRNLLRSFSNVKTLYIEGGLVGDLSRCLELDNGQNPLDLLPKLQDLTYFGSEEMGDALTSSVNARRETGHTVTLTRL